MDISSSLTYGLLSGVHVIANKIVLSKEEFVYPAVFLSWQSLCASVSLAALLFRSRPHSRCTQNVIKGVLPLLPFVTLSAYSASKALAEMPVIVFLSLQCCVQLLTWGVNAFNAPDKCPSRSLANLSYFVLCVFSVSSILLRLPRVLGPSATWMSLHVLCQTLVKSLEQNSLNKCAKSSEHLRGFLYNSSILIILTSSSFAAGDYFHVFTAPHFYRPSFWFAFATSGLCFAIVSTFPQTLPVVCESRIISVVLSLLAFGVPSFLPPEIFIWCALLFLCLYQLSQCDISASSATCCPHETSRLISNSALHSDNQFQSII